MMLSLLREGSRFEFLEIALCCYLAGGWINFTQEDGMGRRRQYETNVF